MAEMKGAIMTQLEILERDLAAHRADIRRLKDERRWTSEVKRGMLAYERELVVKIRALKEQA